MVAMLRVLAWLTLKDLKRSDPNQEGRPKKGVQLEAITLQGSGLQVPTICFNC